MQAAHQTVDDGDGLLLSGLGEPRVARRGGRAGVAEQALDMAQAQSLLEQMGCEAVTQGVDGYFFLIPHSSTTRFIASCVPPRSMGVVAVRIRSIEPLALGKSSLG